MSVYIQRWFRETQPDGSVKEWAETFKFSSLYEAQPAWDRFQQRLNDPTYAKPGVEWGVSCPELEDKEDLPPASERAKWLKEIRGVRLGQA